MLKFLDRHNIKDQYYKLVKRMSSQSPEKARPSIKSARAVSAPKAVKQLEFKRGYPNYDLKVCQNPEFDLKNAVTTSNPPAFGFPILDYCTDSQRKYETRKTNFSNLQAYTK